MTLRNWRQVLWCEVQDRRHYHGPFRNPGMCTRGTLIRFVYQGLKYYTPWEEMEGDWGVSCNRPGGVQYHTPPKNIALHLRVGGRGWGCNEYLGPWGKQIVALLGIVSVNPSTSWGVSRPPRGKSWGANQNHLNKERCRCRLALRTFE
jgi:hypothetical protein